MIEAVGWQNLDEYFRVCSRLLEDDGAMLLQAIVFADDLAFEAEKSARSFANTLVFPGGSCLRSRRSRARSPQRPT
jgi:cyclopropane-fatty-acyl-phospholipid synthase